MYECHKGVKNLLRKVCRRSIDNLANQQRNTLNSLFKERKMTGFWNKLKTNQRKTGSSTVSADHFATYYKDIMKDEGSLTSEQAEIASSVQSYFEQHCNKNSQQVIDSKTISTLLRRLNHNCSPGPDGVSTEHLVYGESDNLCQHLAAIYSAVLSRGVVPTGFTLGIIIPILKKATANPNTPENYRPITLSSVHCKLVELVINPIDTACDSQFGFRKGRGASIPCAMLHDVLTYFNNHNTPVFLASLDAEKCFYKIWDDGSIISPMFFTLFIVTLLLDLKSTKGGISIDSFHLNSFAYVDDVTLFNSTVPGLQQLINKCVAYATDWRFTF